MSNHYQNYNSGNGFGVEPSALGLSYVPAPPSSAYTSDCVVHPPTVLISPPARRKSRKAAPRPPTLSVPLNGSDGMFYSGPRADGRSPNYLLSAPPSLSPSSHYSSTSPSTPITPITPASPTWPLSMAPTKRGVDVIVRDSDEPSPTHTQSSLFSPVYHGAGRNYHASDRHLSMGLSPIVSRSTTSRAGAYQSPPPRPSRRTTVRRGSMADRDVFSQTSSTTALNAYRDPHPPEWYSSFREVNAKEHTDGHTYNPGSTPGAGLGMLGEVTHGKQPYEEYSRFR